MVKAGSRTPLPERNDLRLSPAVGELTTLASRNIIRLRRQQVNGRTVSEAILYLPGPSRAPIGSEGSPQRRLFSGRLSAAQPTAKPPVGNSLSRIECRPRTQPAAAGPSTDLSRGSPKTLRAPCTTAPVKS